MERARGDGIEEPVADPVRLDDRGGEGIGDPVGVGDQLEIGPGALEAAGQLPQFRRVRTVLGPFEEFGSGLRPAVAQLVRGIGIPGEEGRTAGHPTASPVRVGGRIIVHAISAMPLRISTTGASGAGAAPPTTVLIPEVTTAPSTRTAVTSTAWARARRRASNLAFSRLGEILGGGQPKRVRLRADFPCHATRCSRRQ